MKHERTIRNEGSAWAFIYQVAGCFILLFLLPLLALKSSLLESFYVWLDDIDNQAKIAVVVTVVGLLVVGRWMIKRFWV